MDAFPITEAHICGLFVQSVLFGVYIVTVGFTARTLFITETGRWKRVEEVHWPMLSGALVLCGIITLDMAFSFYHSLLAFVFYTGRGGPAEAYDDISSWINIAKSAAVYSETIVGDLMLIYRCWVIYNKSWRTIAISLALWLGCIGCEIRILYLGGTIHSATLASSSSELFPYQTAFWATTVVLNIITTTLLIWRIWKVERESTRYRYRDADSQPNNTLRQVMKSILESGLLYTLTAFATFVTFVTKSSAVYVTTAFEIQVVGIAFNLIIIRGANRNSSASRPTSQATPAGSLPLHFISTSDSRLRRSSISHQGPKIHVSVIQDTFRRG